MKNIFRFIFSIFALLVSFVLTAEIGSAQSTTASAHITSVSAFDGRHQGERYTGALVLVTQVRVNGTVLSRANFSFELSGDYGGAFRNFGASSRRTIPSLSAGVASRVNHSDHGNMYWIDSFSVPHIGRMVRTLDRGDQEVVYAICDLMSQQEFVSSLLPRMVQSRSGDSVYAEYWQNPSRVREVTALASSCLRQMRRLVQFDAPPQAAPATQAIASASPSAPAQSAVPSSSVDQVRVAQTILAAMGLYTSAVDGVAGPGTNRALVAAMAQMNSSAAPTVENFLSLAIGRIRSNDQPVAVPSNEPATAVSNAAELAELQTQNANLTSRLQALREELLTSSAELAEARTALSAALAQSNAESEVARAPQEDVAALERQIAELTAALEQAQTAGRSNEAANATIADLREELDVLRPLAAQLDVLTEQNNRLERQLSAANETVADLRDGIASDERVTEIQRQLDAANATVAGLRDEMTVAYIPVADYVALQRQVSALNATNTEMRERIDADYVPRVEYVALEASSRDAQDTLRNQLAAANQTVAELRERMNTAYVPVAEHEELQRQLAAASATTTELREALRRDYVPRADFLEAQRIQAATNESMADLRRSIETQFMPLQDYNRLERQVSALNSTILELQDRNEIQRNRMLESESLFRNFREDCAAVPECARAMRLD